MEKQIKENKEKRVKLLAEARAIAEAVKDGQMGAEDKAKYDKIVADIAELGETNKRLEGQMKLEAEFRQSAGDPVSHQIAGGAAPDAETRKMEQFRTYLRSGRAGEELRALQIDDPESGGYYGPQQFVTALKKKLDDLLFFRKLATVINVGSADSLGAPTLETDPEDGTWTREIASVDEDTDMKFGLRELKPNLCAKLIKASMKLLQKAPSVEQLIIDRLGYKFGVTQEKGFLVGTGAGQPLGVFVASAQGIATDYDVNTYNTATVLKADNLIAVKYALKESYRRNAAWIGHREFAEQVALMKDGQGRYLWQLSLAAGQPDTVLGYPLHTSEFAPHAFTSAQYVAVFGDFSFYQIAESTQLGVQRLNELYARNNQIGFIGRLEADGMPIFGEAFRRVKMGS